MYTRDELLKRRASLSPAQLALVQKRMRREQASEVEYVPLPRRSSEERIPLSFSQQRLWFLQHFMPETTAYNELIALNLKGTLNREALEPTIRALVQRHEILRTTLPLLDDMVCQVIAPEDSREIKVPFIDLRLLTPTERTAQVHHWTHTQIVRPFQLTEEWPWRIAVLCLSEHEHILLACMHHCITDAWSLELFVSELMAQYRACCTGQPALLKALPVQYADYACWQRQIVTEEKLNRQLEYWLHQLEGPLPVLELPTDHPRPVFWTDHGRRQAWQLPMTLYQSLRTWSQQEHATVFMVLLAVFNILLYRYTMQEDVIVGTATAGRSRPELEHLLGCFINNLALRTDLSGNPSFRELVQRVRRVALEAYEHQDVPFDRLVEHLQPVRDLGRNPIFQVMFVLQNVPLATVDLSDLTVQAVAIETTTTRFDLLLILQESSEGIQGYVEYNSDLFEAATIARFMEQYQRILAEVLLSPDCRISDVQLLSPLEEQRVIVDWNATQSTEQTWPCLHRQFEEQVAQTPDAVALASENEQLSYRELNRLANRAAYALKTRGVGCEALVAILARRGGHFLTAMLATFKAGGAYLPLDPQHPVARLRQVLEHSGSKWVFVTAELSSMLTQVLEGMAPEMRPHVLIVEDVLQQEQREDNPLALTTLHHLAYVIYTSGSTGKPKGVMIEQGGMLNHLHIKIRDAQLSATDVVAQTASQSFDISIWQCLAVLLVGGRVQIFADKVAYDPGQLLTQVQEWGVTILEIVPSILRVALDLLDAPSTTCPNLTALRWLILTGEALDTHLGRRWFTVYPAIPLLNAYGPTECSDEVTHFPIVQSPTSEAIYLPIGRPLTNTQVYVLDKRQKLLPIGVYGELYVGGVGVGRGYLHEPERTAMSFIPDPFSTQPGARLYKTGDLVRYLPDGTLEYNGRIDQQVKIHGLRIELGEIEATLQLHPAISAAVVLAREDLPGDKRLVAYLVLTPDSAASPDDLRHFLQQRLPGFMLPATYMYLERFPVLASGKIDRRALPMPKPSTSEPSTDVANTLDPVVELVRDIWVQVLRCEQMGLHDDFFALGGHSLLAVQVVSRISATFGVEFPLQTFFLHVTISAQAEYIQHALQGAEADLVPPLVVVAHDRPLPLSFTQQRQWFLDQLDPESRLYTLFGAMRLSGQLDYVALEQSLREMIRRHALLRTVFLMQGEDLVQVIQPDIVLPFRVLDLSTVVPEAQEAEIGRLATREQAWKFDLAQGPLLRITVVDLGADEHVLMLTCHHILLDGWSMEIFLNELATLYISFARQLASPLPELLVQYADYACWQHELLQGARLERLLAYWKHRLADLPVLTLPISQQRPQQTTYQAARLPLHVSAMQVEKLKALAHREGVTMYMILLTAFQATLARYSGQSDIVVGSPTANRNRTELEPVLGNFLNTLVLRTDLSGNPTFHEALQRVREVALGAYAHQELPFEKLIQELHPDRDPNRNPLFQVLFAFQNIPEQRMKLPGLTSHFLSFGHETTIFDLDLTLWENDGELFGGLKYNTDVFSETLIERMRDDLLALLDLMAMDVHLHIGDRSLLADDEQARLLQAWNATNCAYNRQSAIHQLFEQQVIQMPDAVAVVFGEQVLTYQELNRQANQLAHHLHFVHTDPGPMVAVLLERSSEMVPALLAVLKAGGCYVPLEPSSPGAYLRWILQRLDISTVITQSAYLPLLAMFADLPALKHVICVDEAADSTDLAGVLPPPMQLWTRQALSRYASTNLAIDVPANAWAYVIFTSGSTGTPKGVVVRHQPVINLIEWVNRTFAMSARDRVLFVTSLCFDLSVYDIFGLLATGGSIQVVARADLHDPDRLLDLLSTTPVTFWDSAPALLQMLPLATRESTSTDRSSLRLVFLSGDWIPIKLPEQVRTVFPGAEVVSLGGATEATVWSNFFRIGEVAPEWTSIPYGRPIQNARYYVLDAYLNPQPIGVPGDLYIGGECLATGYIQEPELTAQKFLPSPFSEQPGMRLYKTGDLARYWPDGNLEFLGRSDTQVKIRGFRVELGEVEATLTRHPGVQVAVADAHRDASGEKSLVAYVVPRQEQPPTVAGLRAYLQTRLPAYMLPSNVVFLAALPMTTNGKVDRRRLPAMAEESNSYAEEATVAPRTPTEQRMAEIWMDALKLKHLSVLDDFFLIGGHSLLAVQLMARIRAAWQISLPLRDLFVHSTVESLSTRVEAAVQAQQVGETLSEGHVLTSPWYEDAVLEPDFPSTVVYAEQTQPLQHIFLTNATGLLGSVLLVELLQNTSAQVICLVRAPDEADGRERIVQALQQDHLWRDEFSPRIVPVCGDLAQPLLGLSTTRFASLALNIDSIYHNGALFSSILPYEEHKAVNVLGMRTILRLAYTGKVKPVHYVSSLGVLDKTAPAPLMEVEVSERDRDALSSGYDQSKWCAEKIIRLAGERGLPVTIYRPGRLTGHSQTGAWRTNDLLCRQIKGCIQLGGVPLEIFEDQMEMIPVDYSSRALVAISLQRQTSGQIFHLLNAASTIDVEHLVAWINDFGYPVEQQPYRVWYEALQRAAEVRTGNVLAPFLATYPEPVSAETEPQVATPRTIYDDQHTQAALAGTSIRCPLIDKQLIHSYLSYFVACGFLPAPSSDRYL